VELFIGETNVRQSLRDVSLAAFPDLHRLAKKFQRGKANLQDVIRLYQVVKSLPELIALLQEYNGKHLEILKLTFTDPIVNLYGGLVKLQELVESTIDLEAADRHEYLIKPEFNEELGSMVKLSRN
jgi:DNA mismatch repair protein MSH2